MGGIWGAAPVWRNTMMKVLREGTRRSPRGKGTIEMCPSVMRFSIARGVPLIKRPGSSNSFPFYEAAWILSGQSSVRGFSAWPEMAKYAEDDGVFYGAYGPPLVESIAGARRFIALDHDSRRAYVPIYLSRHASGSGDATTVPKRDIPCTLGYHFTIEADNRFVVTAVMRSSDMWRGLVYDIFTVSTIGWIVARSLHERHGEFSDMEAQIIALSQHIYEDDVESAKRIVDGQDRYRVTNIEPPGGKYLMPSLRRMELVEGIANDVLNGVIELNESPDIAIRQLEHEAEMRDLPVNSPEFTYLLGACSRGVGKSLLRDLKWEVYNAGG